MTTLEEFEAAPPGSTASGQSAIKTFDDDAAPWQIRGYKWLSDKEMAENGCVLDPPAPTTAREALDLAWNLAHPVKEGQLIPAGTDFLVSRNGERPATMRASLGLFASKADETNLRTLDPLPEPEPDWLDAPAVVAWSRWDDVRREKVWSKADECYKSTDGEVTNWQDLRNVTPLYPKGQEA